MNSVLVLLAAHNGGPWLRPQVESILNQSLKDISVIIGDDCSTDMAVRELQAEIMDERLHVLNFSKPSGGAGQSFIRLLSKVDLRGFEFVALSDQDDIWNVDKLQRAIVMLRNSEADGYSAAVTAFWPDGREMALIQNPHKTDIDFIFEGAGQGCTFLLKCDFARELQDIIKARKDLTSGVHYHDWMIYALSRVLGREWVFDPVPSMLYRQHVSNDTGARGMIGGVKLRLGRIRSGWYSTQVQRIILLLSGLDSEKCSLPADFVSAWTRRKGPVRKVLLSIILLRRGRRRLSDRVILCVSALLGWI